MNRREETPKADQTYVGSIKKEDCFHSETTGEFMGFDDSLALASTELNGHQGALDLLEEKCLALLDHWRFDATGDGQEDLIITASNNGCGSCHGQMLYVFNQDKLIFEEGGEDIKVGQIDRTNTDWPGFTITSPIRLFGESLSDPSYGIESPYQYDQTRGEFKRGWTERDIKNPIRK